MKGTCFAILALAFSIASCNNEKSFQNQSTISVFGAGTILTQPDMARMNISLSKVAQTTRQAQEEVTVMVRQALTILKNAEIEDKNIITASLRFSPEYEWGNARRVLIGQKAEQIITFSVNNINSNNDKVSKIIDQLIQINGIELDQINFGVKDPTDLFIKSRELAYQKAVEKANQYAALAGLKIIKTLSIVEEGIPQITPTNNRLSKQMNLQYAGAMEDAADSSALPTGEIEITTRISVVFSLE